jgi:stage II sporulation protein D
VIIYKGNYIKGWFHSSAGGQTTTAKVGLAYKEKEPEYIVSVESPDQHAPEDVKSWEVSFAHDDVLKVLREAGVQEANNIGKIDIAEKDQTGRAIEL